MDDSHAHLDFSQFDDDREQVIDRALKAGVSRIINVGADLSSSERSIELAVNYPFVYASVGIHPHDADTLNEASLDALRGLATHPRVVAIGEIGLDFYRDLSPRDRQMEAFERQLDLAESLGLPVIVHDRDAHEAVMSVLSQRARSGRAPRGVLHCFSGDLTMARQAIQMGLCLSVGGPVTFENARRLLEVVRTIPLSRLLLETDCPYLAPHPHRGRRNEPAFVALVAQKVAELKEVSLEEVEQVTSDNVDKLFGLDIRQSRGRKQIGHDSRLQQN